MNEKEKEQEQKYLEAVDVSYSYGLAKAMERIKSNPVLGFRTAGSRAEYETGEMLRQEMERIGLEDIHKDRLCLDGWEFEKAVLRFRDAEGAEHVFQLGAYQTQFLTGGFQKFPLVYVGRGGAQDYAGRDVRGCLVLVDINQRDEWWINFPVYQAHLKGAAAVIAVQDNGYGEIDGEALNAQDIAGPKDAPAFSISQKDAAVLKEALQKEERLTVEFDASSRILEQTESYNIWGTIPGREEDMILLSAHYDSYYDGLQDDNCAVAMMLGIARALLETGYRPRKTLVFCAMAAEEWGIVNSKYDWSTGAWQQVFKLRPDWPGKVIADLNFELPAYAHNAWDAIRSTYEYEDFLKEFVEKLPVDPTNVYPQGLIYGDPLSFPVRPGRVLRRGGIPVPSRALRTSFDGPGPGERGSGEPGTDLPGLERKCPPGDRAGRRKCIKDPDGEAGGGREAGPGGLRGCADGQCRKWGAGAGQKAPEPASVSL